MKILIFRDLAACSKFLPKLHFFRELNSTVKTDYEIIFCSLDKSEEDYNQHIEEMPWWCLPYATSTLPMLIAKLQANRMPHLVVIDTEGNIITKEGANALKQDPTGKHFPWRPKRIVDILPSSYRSGELSTDDEIVLQSTKDLDEKYILLYFASKLDALSQEFTPWLMKAYNILKNKRQDFEVSTAPNCNSCNRYVINPMIKGNRRAHAILCHCLAHFC